MGDMNGAQAADTTDNSAPALDEDVDAVALREALAAANAEEAIGQTIEAPTTAPAAQAPAGTDQPQTQVPNEPATHMIPKARMDEVLNKVRHFESEATRLAAELAAAKAAQGPQAPAIDPRETEITSKMDALYKRFDDGEITLSDMKREERAFDAQLRALQEEQLLSRIPKEAAPAQAGESLQLQTETATLDQQFPYVQHLKRDDLFMIRDRAISQLVAEGKYQGVGGEAETLLLRRRVGELTEKFGPVLLDGNDPVAAQRAVAGKSPAPAAPGAPPLSPQASARLAKTELAADMPVPVDGLTAGSTAAGGQYSEDAILRMTEEEREAIPRAVLARLAAGT